MSAAAVAHATKPLRRERALEIINSMPYLVSISSRKLLRSQFEKRPWNHISRVPEIPVQWMHLEICEGQRSYVFEKRPFRIIRAITREEFMRAAPWALAPARNCYFYEIHTD